MKEPADQPAKPAKRMSMRNASKQMGAARPFSSRSESRSFESEDGASRRKAVVATAVEEDDDASPHNGDDDNDDDEV